MLGARQLLRGLVSVQDDTAKTRMISSSLRASSLLSFKRSEKSAFLVFAKTADSSPAEAGSERQALVWSTAKGRDSSLRSEFMTLLISFKLPCRKQSSLRARKSI